MALAPAFSVLAAILALLPATVALIVNLFDKKNPQYCVIKFSVDNITDPNGRLDPHLDFSIDAQITNLSDEPLVVDDSLGRYTRDSPTASPSTLDTEVDAQGDQLPVVTILRTVGFELYFENSEKP